MSNSNLTPTEDESLERAKALCEADGNLWDDSSAAAIDESARIEYLSRAKRELTKERAASFLGLQGIDMTGGPGFRGNKRA
jgi:hypothetical protein